MSTYIHTNIPNDTDSAEVPFVPNVPNTVRVNRVFGNTIANPETALHVGTMSGSHLSRTTFLLGRPGCRAHARDAPRTPGVTSENKIELPGIPAWCHGEIFFPYQKKIKRAVPILGEKVGPIFIREGTIRQRAEPCLDGRGMSRKSANQTRARLLRFANA